MIATVRIAPIERWCGVGLRMLEATPEIGKFVGSEISIHPNRMQKAVRPDCGGRVWAIEATDAGKYRRQIGGTYEGEERFLCEHMLEMD